MTPDDYEKEIRDLEEALRRVRLERDEARTLLAGTAEELESVRAQKSRLYQALSGYGAAGHALAMEICK